jgi:hypothetical protein
VTSDWLEASRYHPFHLPAAPSGDRVTGHGSMTDSRAAWHPLRLQATCGEEKVHPTFTPRASVVPSSRQPVTFWKPGMGLAQAVQLRVCHIVRCPEISQEELTLDASGIPVVRLRSSALV